MKLLSTAQMEQVSGGNIFKKIGRAVKKYIKGVVGDAIGIDLNHPERNFPR